MKYQYILVLLLAVILLTVRAFDEVTIEDRELLSLERVAEFSTAYFDARLRKMEEEKKASGEVLGHACSFYGIDLYSLITPQQASCLFNRGFRFSIHRAFQSNNRIDPNAPRAIINARNAGFKYIDIYMFPNMYESPTSQIKRLTQSLKDNNVKYGMLWLDIERFDWPKNKQSNRQFITELIRAAGTYTGHALGIYSNRNNWDEITGLDFRLNSTLPLWYAHYDNWHSFDDFSPFSSFRKPDIKQYVGDKMVCGVDIDENCY